YRHRPAADQRRRVFRAGPSGRPGRPGDRRDRWRSGDRRNVPDGVRLQRHSGMVRWHQTRNLEILRARRNDLRHFFTVFGWVLAGACGFFGADGFALSTAELMSSISLETRAALLPRSLSK